MDKVGAMDLEVQFSYTHFTREPVFFPPKIHGVD